MLNVSLVYAIGKRKEKEQKCSQNEESNDSHKKVLLLFSNHVTRTLLTKSRQSVADRVGIKKM